MQVNAHSLPPQHATSGYIMHIQALPSSPLRLRRGLIERQEIKALGPNSVGTERTTRVNYSRITRGSKQEATWLHAAKVNLSKRQIKDSLIKHFNIAQKKPQRATRKESLGSNLIVIFQISQERARLHFAIKLSEAAALIKHCPFKAANVLIEGWTCP